MPAQPHEHSKKSNQESTFQPEGVVQGEAFSEKAG